MPKYTVDSWSIGTVASNGYSQKIFINGESRIEVCGKDPDRWTDEDRAVVRIVTTAPKLLEACKLAFRELVNVYGEHLGMTIPDKLSEAITLADPDWNPK